MFPSHPPRNGAPYRPGRTLPEVAEPDCPQDEQLDSSSLTDEAALKVLLKRNLRPQAPPPDLLGTIRARIAGLRAD
ncbi:hypothetical protein LEM8419_03128 [Neolewinella maritima]|uniref:Uncharacterized protein n=1 Tax=Neolewinella maritima TaxID=1383882 RepID=A0ABN8FDJ2_9BACT|nr:hypothetical protein [Neolewinella maritima]CAH1002211.1 hypothetical protein LEM8419_03128 [Neolewinella maritima]